MRKFRVAALWILAGVLSTLFVAWIFPFAYPLFPTDWQVSRQEAQAIALERLRELGDLPERRYVVTRQDESPALEYRLQSRVASLGAESILSSELVKGLLTWETTVWATGARAQEWSHRARVTPAGEVTELLVRVAPDHAGESISQEEARDRADAFLRGQGIDLDRLDAPEIRTRQLSGRIDMSLRYRYREAVLGSAYPYGIEVSFAGARLAGVTRFFDDPELAAVRDSFQPIQLLAQAKVFLPLVLLPLVAIPFVRRYHAGEIGVRRGVQISVVVVACGLVSMYFSAADAAATGVLGVLSRRQATVVVGCQMVVLFFFPIGLMSFLSWSVGESLCRERQGRRLAAFDALFQGEWTNATFAWASLRGLVSGVVLVGIFWTLIALLREVNVWAYGSFVIGPWWESSSWFSIPLLTFGLAYSLYMGLFGSLFLVSFTERWVGRWAAVAIAALSAVVLFFAPTYVEPFAWNLPLWMVPPLGYIFLFLRYGIYTSILASFTAFVVSGVLPFLGAADALLQLQASLALAGVALPLVVSVKWLLSQREFVYRYEDIPPHVRRIAERERQRVELETARGIQASILPDLPPLLNGVKLTYKYLPATEVGGDFYDVLALEDGRLAVAVGDVAGHGVSSGLVMSMTKSALAVQVCFNPEVEAVFATLNRLVHQSARRRMLTTLCYALIDPGQREMTFASAGHLFPYRISAAGEVVALESVSYPLGVRRQLNVKVRASKLQPEDALFMFSDGVVEARPQGTDEMFGFERLEDSLARHAGSGVEGIRDGVLADLERFAGSHPREDDLTVLVLQIP